MTREVHIGTKMAYDDPVVAKKYLEAYGQDFHKELAKDFARSLPGKRVLDLGCGPGHYVRHFSQLGCEVTGLDYSDAMIRIARGLDKRAHFEIGDIRDVGIIFPTNSFDGVWANASLLHIPLADVGEVMDGVARVLSNGGKFLIRTKKGKTGMQEVEEDLYGATVKREYTYWEEEDLKAELEKHGFIIIESVDEHEDVRVEKSKRSIDWIQITAEVRK